VTLHINNTPKAIFTVLDSLHTLYTSTPKASTHVDVHLIIDSFDRQFNTWRNIARLFARTSFVMMLDVDFALCTDFRTSIRSSKAVMDKLKGGRVALVVPAFEYVNRSEGMNQSTFPRDKEVCTRHHQRYVLIIPTPITAGPTHSRQSPSARDVPLRLASRSQ
jgi:hypothetical protein